MKSKLKIHQQSMRHSWMIYLNKRNQLKSLWHKTPIWIKWYVSHNTDPINDSETQQASRINKKQGVKNIVVLHIKNSIVWVALWTSTE